MDARFALPAINFLMADVGGGLGAFLSTWLAEARHWTPGQIGTVIAMGSLVGAVFSGPAGSVVDRFGRPRLMLGVACGLIVGGTLALLPFHAFVLVMVAQFVVATGGALGAPSLSGLTLAVVGKERFPRQQGTNDAANHAGNVFAALAIAGLAYLVGPTAAVYVLVVMATATVAVLFAMDPGAIDGERMRGRKPRGKGEKRGMTRSLLKNRRLYLLLAVVGLFQLGSSAMLPLLGQRVVAEGAGNATGWMSACVIAAQLTMVPVALLTGRLADKVGRRWLLLFACTVAAARCVLAMFATSNWWLIPIEILDGLGAGVFSVAVPVTVADLTYGSGRTQTAMGFVGTMLAGGAALASLGGGLLAQHAGYYLAFGAMGVFVGGAALLLVFTPATERKEDQPPEASGDGSGDDSGGGGGPSGKAAAISAAA